MGTRTRLSEAIVIYTGRNCSTFPARSLDRLLERFDALTAADLAVEVNRLDEEFYEVEPAKGESLNDAADRAAATFAARHRDLSQEAVDALRWCYTFDWK